MNHDYYYVCTRWLCKAKVTNNVRLKFIGSDMIVVWAEIRDHDIPSLGSGCSDIEHAPHSCNSSSILLSTLQLQG